MRVIAGQYKGMQLYTPTGKETRPTTDRVKQTLFDILLHAEWGGKRLFNHTTVLDAFAGTGALGIEALSRGAKTACFCEKSREARQVLEKNLHRCHLLPSATLFNDLWTLPVASSSCDLLFLDPPYGQGLIIPALHHIRKQQWLTHNTVIVTEIAWEEKLDLNESYALLTERKIGTTYLKIWQYKDIP